MKPLFFMVLGMALAGFAVSARADPAMYAAKEIRGRVVDAVSGEPLAGATVVAQWELVREVIPGVINKSYGDVLKTIEVVTDKDGRYTIPAWGPVARPAFFHLEHRDPAIEILLPGYYPRHVANRILASYNRDALRISRWDGEPIALRKFTGEPQEYLEDNGQSKVTVRVSGTLNEYASKLSGLQILLHWGGESNEWRNFPRMVATLARERERLAAAGLSPNYQIDRIDSLHGGREAVDRFLKGYEK